MQGVLALDQGSHASRAVIFDSSGRECAAAEALVATVRRGTDEVEHDAEALLASVHSAAGQALRAARQAAPGLELIAAGLATQRSTIVCCELGSLRPLTAAISWQDRRNAAWLEGLRAHEPRIRALTGLPLSAHYGASKIRWCLDHLPAVRAAATRGELLTLPLAAWLVGRLTGSVHVDPASAARTLLWDSAVLDWSAEICALFGIEREWLPPTGPTRQRFGDFTIDGHMLPLTACTGDQSAVPFAFGVPDAATACVNLGTGAFIQRPLAARPAAPEPLLGSILALDEQGPTYSLEGTVNGAGSAVAAFSQDSGIAEGALWPLLDTLPDDAILPLFINGVGGFGSPWWHPEACAEFIGEGSLAERFAAVVESIVFMIAENLDLMAQRGGPLHHIAVTGGLARSDWLCRRLAAVLGLPVERCGLEATARGTAALAAPETARTWHAGAQTMFTPRAMHGVAERRGRYVRALRSRFGLR
jgi:glycerol kinase